MRQSTSLLSLLALALVLASGFACTSDAPIAVEDGGARSDGGGGSDGGEARDGGASDGGAVCPGDLAAAEGTPCPVDDQWCGECPGGPCTFCNRLHCESGLWVRFEAFPDPACEDGGVDDGGASDGGAVDGGASDGGGALGAGEVCDPAASLCGAGLTCCYPCGIPDCDYVCEVTCSPGDPGCFDGCFLRP